MKLSTQISYIVKVFGFEEGVKLLHRAGCYALDLSLFTMKLDDCEYVGAGWH